VGLLSCLTRWAVGRANTLAPLGATLAP